MPKDDATPLISAFDPRSDLSGALRDWRALLGDVHVLADEQVRDHYARSTSSSSRRPAAILKPGTRDEVVKVVRIARRCRTPLYPISTGQNWGYGDACAVYDGQVIVDLGRMNRIEHVDTELGYAVIEPGVTQGQLSRYLAEQGVPFWIDCTGAGPNSSFIGNIVERGFGHSPYGNRFETISGMEVVLGTGEVLRTGFGHYPGAKTTHLYPYGIGPYLDGIFTQSNFGIVTQLGLWLQPIPESFCPYIVLFKEDQDLLEAIPRLQKLRLNRILQSVPHIGNDLRALASDAPFPRDRLPAQARLTPEVRAALRKEAGIGAWSMSGAFYGTSRQVALHKKLLKHALANVDAKVIFLPRHLLAAGQWFVRRFGHLAPFRGLEKKIRLGSALAGMHSGVPTGAFLRGCYWRHQAGVPADFSDDSDLARERIGLMWMAPIIPFRREDLALLNQEMDALFARFGFDCHVTVNMINGRALAAVYTIDFDAEDEAETRRGVECYEAGVRSLFELGYPLYRSSVRGMGLLASQRDDGFCDVVDRLKLALDPGAILAPGRYDWLRSHRAIQSSQNEDSGN
ncbi:MAG: FAD-binding oxidoreductase [Candidatus Accumulibacter phosphatis]|uniref:FAD-binding oxidoreductase n=1 Tax=Candidatus Accumulibacter contiguus TaxID=2954381 RepID=UPI00145F03B2|nr:FAD-binding oxidoreductase [Candidatus Accumulibacter contiguus]